MAYLPRIILTEGLENTPLLWLRAHAQVQEISARDPAALAGALRQAEGLIVRTYTQVNAALLATAPLLRAVGRAGVGLDNIDQPACGARGVKVFSTPSANTQAVCEYVLNLIFSWGRPLVRLTEAVPADVYHGYRKSVRGMELHGQTIGIVGMGRIGHAVGRVAHALGMRVLYNDLVPITDLDFPATATGKEQLFRESDIITIHTDMRAGNHHLVNAHLLSLCQAHALLLNTARGQLVDAAALAAALKSGQLAGAALDVQEPEPPTAEYPLLGLPNVILAPHLAARTQGAMDRMSWVARDVVEYLVSTHVDQP